MFFCNYYSFEIFKEKLEKKLEDFGRRKTEILEKNK